MLTLPKKYDTLFSACAPIFSKRVWPQVLVLVVGAILAPGKRTVTSVLQIMGLSGDEQVTLQGLSGDLKPLAAVPCTIRRDGGEEQTIELRCRIDTEIEIEYMRHGGVLHYVLRHLARD